MSVLLGLLCAGVARAQGSADPGAVRTLLGDVALILRTDQPGILRIGISGVNRTLTLAVRHADARRWADSAALLVAPPPRRARSGRARADTAVRRRVVLEEPGAGDAALVFSRTDSAGTRQFLLFADDATLDGIRQPLSIDEARLLVRLIRRSATPPRPSTPRKKPPSAG